MPNNEFDLQLKLLEYQYVRTLVDWATSEGWNPGPYDADVCYTTDPEGFYGYFIDDQLIAGGAVISYNGLFGFMGLFIVRPDYRSLGIGNRLWHQRINLLQTRLKPGAPIGMDGVVAMQPFYNKGGFRLAFRSERHCRQGEVFNSDPSINQVNVNHLDRIILYDSSCFGFARPQFLKPWLGLPGSFNFEYVVNGQIKGYASMRKANEGFKIGPLFADSPEIAESLYRACLSSAPGEAIFLDIPVVNDDAMQMAKKYNTTYVFECARMYYGDPPALPLGKIFGITSFELG